MLADLAAEIDANKQTSDTGAIEAVIAKILADNANKVMSLTGGKLEVPLLTVGRNTLRGYEQNAWANALDGGSWDGDRDRLARLPPAS